jgi:MFS transporter, ACS family, glucarate transporter
VASAQDLNQSSVLKGAPDRPTRVRYVVLAFLCVLAFLTYFDRVCITSAQLDIERDLHLTNNQWGLVMGAFWLAYGFLEIPAGALGDRFGARGMLAGVALAWSAFTALSGAAMSFTSLLTYRILFGAGEAGAYPNIARAQHGWFPIQSHARVGGLLWLVSRWGGALSYVIFPALLAGLGTSGFRRALNVPGLRVLANVPSWRMGFWICGIAGLIWVLLFYPWFRDEPANKRSVNPAEVDLIRRDRPAGRHAHARFDARTWRMFLTNRSLWLIAIAYTGTSFGWSFLVSWMNQFLLDVYHVSYSGSPWLKTSPLFVGGMACLIGGVLSDLYVRRTGRTRFGRIIFPIIGATVAGIAMACIPLTRSSGQAMALVCLASLGTDIGQAPAWATIIGIGGEYAGTAFGFINMIANAGGNFLAPVICPRIVGRFGWGTMMYVYAAAFLVAAVMWLFIDPRRRFYDVPVKELLIADC